MSQLVSVANKSYMRSNGTFLKVFFTYVTAVFTNRGGGRHLKVGETIAVCESTHQLGRSGGMLPLENFLKSDALRLLLWHF